MTASPTATPRIAATVPAATADASSKVEGWQSAGEPQRYDRETLYDLVNGAADLYFSYGFEEATVEQYADDQGRTARVEVYNTRSDADAYGLYTYHSYGEAIELGVDGERAPGYRLAFWQGRAFVQIVTREAVDDGALWALGEAIAESLPQGGTRPALVASLPEQGLQAGSVRFFREKIALDNLIWLGTDDLLGLGPDVQGVVARYEIEDKSADLLWVAYPDAARAELAFAALVESGIEELVEAGVREGVLGAVFGTVSAEAAGELLAALGQ
jgi:hypothetical protein